MTDIVRQGAKGILREQRRLKSIGRAHWEAIKSIAGGPLKTKSEVAAMAGFETQGLLRELRVGGHGISVIVCRRDNTFPLDRIRCMLKPCTVDSIIVVEGSHNEIYLRPEAITMKIDQLLDAMERKKEK